MTRKQIAIIVAVNAAISMLISLGVVVLVVGPAQVASRLQGQSADGLPVDPGDQSSPGPSAGTQVAAAVETPAHVIHVVKSGDTILALALRYGVSADDITTANGLENPDAIQEGMELLIPVGGLPEASATPPPIPTPSSTATMPFEPPSVQTSEAVAASNATPVPSRTPLTTADQPQIEITQIVEPGNLELEGVVLTNIGDGVADLEEWVLSDSDANQYVFARVTLWPGGSITLYTRAGEDSADSLFWGSVEAIWSPDETAILDDAEGKTVSTHTPGQ